MVGRSSKLFVASVMAVALVAVACAKKTTTPAATGGIDTNGGIVYSLDQEGTNFNVLTSDGNNFNVQAIVGRVLPSVFHADPTANVFLDKDLMDSVTLTSTSPQTVVYKINPKAKWQDGVPFNADDFVYSYQAQSGLPQYTDVGGVAYDAASNTGYNQIASVTASPDKFTVTTTYATPFADWRSLFATMPPAHIMKTAGWNKAWLAANINAQNFLSAGPFEFKSYTQGKDFILQRNPTYWAAPSNLATVDFRFITDSSQVEPALANNEINASYPQPQLDLVNQLKSVQNVKLEEKPGLQYEHLDFNEANPFLADINLRKAIAMSIDRTDLIAKTVGQFATGIVPDNNHIYVPGQPQYRDNSAGPVTSTATGAATTSAIPAASPGPYDKVNLEGAKALLTSNGYTITGTPPVLKNKAGKVVTLRITSTQGNKLRNSEEAFVINALAPLGITVTEKDTTGLGKTLSSHDFDLFIFAWVDTPYPSGNDSIFQTTTKSTGGQNYDGYSDKTVDSLVTQADVALDPAKQTDLYNQVDALLWKDMATLPLFQKPTLLVYQTKYKNLQNNITSEGPSYNMEQWALSK
jgi:peptide/nickel transport system substrate-binding protein